MLLLRQREENYLVAKVEQTTDVDYVDEVAWNDRGYYEIEYYMKDGAKAEINIDPKPANPLSSNVNVKNE